jgi:predicted RNA-binding protein with PUA-like domain
MSQKIWLMKSEPDVFSIDDLKKEEATWWTGVRNYQARNFMTKDMQVGDTVLFYHSNAEPPGIAGVAQVSKPAQPDPLQFDKKSDYFDPKATKEKPNWFCVEVKFVSKFKKLVPLDQLKTEKLLADMMVIKKGQRLSIQPVSETEFKVVQKLGQ